MASLRGIFQGILDSTELDEKLKQGFRNTVNRVDRNKQQPGFQIVSPKTRQNISSNINKFNQFSQNALNSPVGAPARFVKGFGQNIADSAIKSGDYLSQRQELINQRQAGKSLSERIKPQNFIGTPKENKLLGMGAWQSAKTLQKLNPQSGGLGSSMATGALTGGLRTALTPKSEDRARAFGEGFGEGIGLRALTRFTDPYISQNVDKVGGGLLMKQLGQRSVAGIGNVVEDEILAQLDDYKNTNTDRAISLGIGLLSAGNAELAGATKKKAGELLEKLFKAQKSGSSKQKKKVAEELVSFLGKDGKTYLRRGNKLAGSVGAKIEEPKKIRFVQDPDQPNRLIRVGYEDSPDRLRGLSNAYGAVAGIEPYQDEEGNWKVRYNSGRGMLGMGIMAGRNAIDYDNAIKFSSLLDKKPRFEIDDSGVKLMTEKLDTPSFTKTQTDGGIIFDGKLRDLLDHPELYKNYPQLKNANVEINPNKKWTQRGEYSTLPNGEPIINITGHDKYEILTDYQKELKDWRRVLSSKDELIKEAQSLNEPVEAVKEAGIARVQDLKQRIKDIKDVPDDAKSTLLHEIQHAIQEIEGFARGGSPSSFTKLADDASGFERNMKMFVDDQLRKEGKQYADLTGPGEIEALVQRTLDSNPGLRDDWNRYSKLSTNPVDIYKRLSGELEARAVQRRMDMPQNIRIKTDPYSAEARVTADSTDPNNFITRFDTDSAANIKISDDIKTRNKATGVPDSAVKELDELMNYPKYLAQMGYSADQIDSISATEARKLIDNKILPFQWEMEKTHANIPPIKIKQESVFKGKPTQTPRGKVAGEITDEEVDQTIAKSLQEDLEIPKLKKWFNKTFNPIKNAPEDVQKWVGDWRKKILSTRVDANNLGQGLKEIPEEDGLKIMKYIQNPSKKKANELGLDVDHYKDSIKKIRIAYDTLRKQGMDQGLDIGYLENYLNQVWKEPLDEIVKARGLGKNPGFTKERVIPSYEEGIKLGLTPRFTHPAQLIAHYKYQLGKAMANKKLSDQLAESGYLLPSNKAPLDWKAIDAPLFPNSQMKMRDQVVIQDYKAPPNIAKALNSIFEPKAEGGLMHTAANVSKKMQDLTLSGGVPKTPINSFALANAVKEITSGRVKSPVTSFFRSFSDDATKNFFRDNKQYLKMMGEEGIPSYTNTDYTQVHKNIAENKNLKEVLGDKWDELMGDPTFKRFLPQLQVNLFKDTYDKAVKDGVRPTEARKLAGEVTKNFYGLVDNISRPQFTEDSMSALFFAPRFREGMVNFWGKNLQALYPKNITNKEFSQNRKFLIGTILTGVLYELLNKKLTGHWMHENKDGKKTSLEISVGPGRSWYIPILPSIATVPRRGISAIEELSGGDVAGATKELGGFLSQPISLGSQLLSNRTFYGGPIYQYDDPALDKLKKLGGYTFEQTSHPFVGEPMSVIQGRKTPVEAAMGALELPVYPSRSTDTAHLKGRAITKFKDLAKIDPKSAYAYADKFRKDYDKLSDNIKISDASDKVEIPENFETLTDLYKEAAKKGTGYVKKKEDILYDPTLSQAEKELKIADLREETVKWAELKIKIEDQKPEKVFEIKLDTYKSGGGMNVEERAKWAAGELTQAAGESDEAFNKKLDAMLESKVITKSVAEELRDTYDLPVSQYNSGGKIKSLGGSGSGSSKGKKITTKNTPAVKYNMKPISFASKVSRPNLNLKPPQIKPYKSSQPAMTRIVQASDDNEINTKITSPRQIRIKGIRI